MILKQAKKLKIQIEVLENISGELNGTLLSATLSARGENLSFIKEWEGSVLWIWQSPYRKFHKRKNWFVAVAVTKETEGPAHNFSFQSFYAQLFIL